MQRTLHTRHISFKISLGGSFRLVRRRTLLRLQWLIIQWRKIYFLRNLPPPPLPYPSIFALGTELRVKKTRGTELKGRELGITKEGDRRRQSSSSPSELTRHNSTVNRGATYALNAAYTVFGFHSPYEKFFKISLFRHSVIIYTFID